MLNNDVKFLCLTTQRERERQFVICTDSCFQSTGPQKDDVISERRHKFSENTENETIMKTRQQNTLFELRRRRRPGA